MKYSDNLLKWLTICANIAILIGLVFVSFELRQNRNVLKLQSQDAIADGFVQLNLASLSDSSVARVWVIGLYDPDQLSDVEAIRFSFYMRGVYNQFYRIYSLYKTGTISKSEWASYAQEASYLSSSPGGRIYFQDNWMPDGFGEEVRLHHKDKPNINFQLGRKSLPD